MLCFKTIRHLWLLALCVASTETYANTTQHIYDARGRLIEVSNASISSTVYYKMDDANNRIATSNTPIPDTPVISSFSAPASVAKKGASASIKWTSTNSTHCSIAVGGDASMYPSLPTSGTQAVVMLDTTAVVVWCHNNGLSASQGRIIQVNGIQN